MKLHKVILNIILEALNKIIKQNHYSDKVLEHYFRTNRKLGKTDRKIIAESVYNIVRYYYLYEYIAQSDDLNKILSSYFYFNHILFDNLEELLPNIDVKQIDISKIPDRIKYSYNEELWLEGLNQLGEEKWFKEAEALNQQAKLVIRVNTLITTKKELQQLLYDSGIESVEHPEVEEALIIQNKTFLSPNEYFLKGYYEFQDLSSQRVAHFIPKDILEQANRIIDACAGAGGKSLHLSALKQNKGQIIALDIESKKLNELKKRAKRNRSSNIIIKPIESSKTIKRLKNSADILLLDVPCTGTGVIKRNPDTKLKFSKDNMNNIIELQRDILLQYSKMLKEGGYLLYATCSILPLENEYQIQWFIKNKTQFELIKYQTIYPSEGFDGFFMALLKKK
ncbi:MAG: RNA methyltransferase [Leptospiraceae bacterium]|nr:MAG: RNA methyltransferase [Leptospiraceae bacterium]